MKNRLLLIFGSILLTSIGFGQCDTEASFEYDLVDGTYHFENTSTGEDEFPIYFWTIDGEFWSDDENPTLGEGDVLDGTTICLTVSDEETACEDEYCVTFEVDEEPCEVDANFEYELIDGTYHFYNTSTGEGETPIFEWSVDGDVWSDDENPTLGGGDVEDGTVICLTVWTGDGDEDCGDEICIEIEEEEDPCDLEAGFEYELIDGVYYFYNESTGEWDETTYQWIVDGETWSEDENPTLGEGDVFDGSTICLVVVTYSEDAVCTSEYCEEMDVEDPCELEAGFEYELIDGVYHFYNTSSGEWEETTYQWLVDGETWSDDENPTLGEGDVTDESTICLVVVTYLEDMTCTDEFCIEMGDEEPCEVEAGFEYEIIDGTYHFYNTSEGEGETPIFEWTVDGIVWSDDENPTLGGGDVEDGTVICLTVWTGDGDEDCGDDFCMEIEEDPCELEASFEYELIDGVYHFYNTSTDEWEETTYQWLVDGETWSDDENPTLGEGDVTDESTICLVVVTYLEEMTCTDEFCVEMGDEEPCEVEAGFEYEIIDGTYHFYNTSEGEGETPIFEWTVDGIVWSDDENPTLGGGDVEDGTVICLTVWTGDGDEDCGDEFCMEIEEDPCELEAGFEFELIDGVYHFYNTSTGEWVESTYQWLVDGETWSDDENPTLGEGDVTDGTVICLVVVTYGEGMACTSEYCEEMGDEDPCELEAGFEFELIEDTYYFYNTSTGEYDDSEYHWFIDGTVWSELENPTLGADDIESGTEICLAVLTYNDAFECEDETCYEFGDDLAIEDESDLVIKLYPNPVQHTMNIQISAQTNIQEVWIYNTIGERVMAIQNAINGHSLTLDLSELESGIYYIQLIDAHGAYANPQQIVKQ